MLPCSLPLSVYRLHILQYGAGMKLKLPNMYICWFIKKQAGVVFSNVLISDANNFLESAALTVQASSKRL